MAKKMKPSENGAVRKAKRSLERMMESLAPYMLKPDVVPSVKPRGWSIPQIRVPGPAARRRVQDAPSSY